MSQYDLLGLIMSEIEEMPQGTTPRRADAPSSVGWLERLVHGGVSASRRRYPSYGFCVRCEVTFPEQRNRHTTGYCACPDGRDRNQWGCRGVEPLCVPCWETLTPEQRVPYYEQLIDDWLTDATSPAEIADIERQRPLIVSAVLAGR